MEHVTTRRGSRRPRSEVPAAGSASPAAVGSPVVAKASSKPVMERLIPVINKLQDVFATVGERDALELPQIVVVGAQSSGKSSVLENIVGRDFLPRGTGIVTRVPLVMQLINVSDQGSAGAAPGAAGSEGHGTAATAMAADPSTAAAAAVAAAASASEWAVFLHSDEVFTDFELVRQEIADRTEKLTRGIKGISDSPINLKIYSPHVLNLTLVDLPGITKVPVGDQPQDIERQIRNLVLTYIRNPSSIILAVSPANSDIANSDSLQLAREVDPEGDRTLGVCTKLDLMDKGTDAMDVLTGKVVPVKLGIIGVVNRSQYDIEHRKCMREATRAEEGFFQKHYPGIAHRCGSAYLGKSLNKILMHHIRDCLPELKRRIKDLQHKTEHAMQAFGDKLEDEIDKGALLLASLTSFCNTFRAAVHGQSPDIADGAHLSDIFHETFRRSLQDVDALDDLGVDDILKAIRSATGTRPALFLVPDTAFIALVKRQIRKLEDPALRCLELVYEELERLMQACAVQVVSRFRPLRESIISVMSELLRKRLQPTQAMVENLLAIELAYINTSHPDFEGGARAFARLMQIAQAEAERDAHTNTDRDAPLAAESDPGPPEVRSPEQQRGWYFNLLGSRASKPEPETPSILNRGNSVELQRESSYIHDPLTEKQRMEIELIQSLIQSYFFIVKRNVQDTVPKAAMHFLVNHVTDHVQNELVRALYKKENFEALLEEDAYVAAKRQSTAELLAALNRAALIISEVSGFDV
eukprot:m.128161 g.128161  ORF g.128161 m.128161 type:complete len:755 (-) comp16727_c1_seq1:514-2778(-)